MKLTTRENQVISLLVTGLDDKSIASQMGVSVRTVHAHLANIYTKFKVQNRSSAILFWLNKEGQSCGKLLQGTRCL